jgi:hypothetical protein
MTSDNEFEVFKGVPGGKVIRLGAVRGRDRATHLMYRMYARLPGDYFVWDTVTMQVASSVQARMNAPNSVGEPNFDIFQGLADKNAVWVETVEGLAAARARMEEIARGKPATYFIFCRFDHSILAYIDTDASPVSQKHGQSDITAA